MRRFILSLMLLALALPARAEDITATVLAIRDGDTLKVELHGECLPGLFRVMLVRVRGCDTPELKDERPEMRALAERAREKAAELAPVGSQVTLRRIGWDKYGGRILADVDGLCDELIDAGLAREYWGKGKKPW